MIILVSGVVLLTYKKPEPKGATPQSGTPRSGRGHRSATKGTFASTGRDEEEALHEGGIEHDDGTMWQLGEASEDEDEAGGVRSPKSPRSPRMQPGSPSVQRKVSGMSLKPTASPSQIQISSPRGRVRSRGEDEEASMLADQGDADDDDGIAPRRRPSLSPDSDATLSRPDAATYMDDDAFGAWEASPPVKSHS